MLFGDFASDSCSNSSTHHSTNSTYAAIASDSRLYSSGHLRRMSRTAAKHSTRINVAYYHGLRSERRYQFASDSDSNYWHLMESSEKESHPDQYAGFASSDRRHRPIYGRSGYH